MDPEAHSAVILDSRAALKDAAVVEEDKSVSELVHVDDGEDFEKDSKVAGILSEDVSKILQPELERSDDSVGNQVASKEALPLEGTAEGEDGEHPEGAAGGAAPRSDSGARLQWSEQERQEHEYVCCSQTPWCLGGHFILSTW